VTGWVFAHRPSNRQRHRWVVSLLDVHHAAQVLELGFGPGVAVAELVRAGAGHVYGIDHSGAAREIEDLLRDSGFSQVSTQTLPLSPPVICVLAASPACATTRAD
jgi:protein-L-isoaspartate O-methyltransferase